MTATGAVLREELLIVSERTSTQSPAASGWESLRQQHVRHESRVCRDRVPMLGRREEKAPAGAWQPRLTHTQRGRS